MFLLWTGTALKPNLYRNRKLPIVWKVRAAGERFQGPLAVWSPDVAPDSASSPAPRSQTVSSLVDNDQGVSSASRVKGKKTIGQCVFLCWCIVRLLIVTPREWIFSHAMKYVWVINDFCFCFLCLTSMWNAKNVLYVGYFVLGCFLLPFRKAFWLFMISAKECVDLT